MMNQEIKVKWVAALRSGDYNQGKGSLKSEDKFCCLGVLCDLHSKTFGTQWATTEGNEDKYYLGTKEVLPNDVMRWADLDWQNPKIREHQTSLTELNDSGDSFEEIADIIEKYL